MTAVAELIGLANLCGATLSLDNNRSVLWSGWFAAAVMHWRECG